VQSKTKKEEMILHSLGKPANQKDHWGFDAKLFLVDDSTWPILTDIFKSLQ
jgi:hypothetical protein